MSSHVYRFVYIELSKICLNKVVQTILVQTSTIFTDCTVSFTLKEVAFPIIDFDYWRIHCVSKSWTKVLK